MLRLLRQVLSKALALGLLAGAAFLVFTLVVEPLVGRFTSAQERIAEQRALLGRLNTAASQEPATTTTGKPAPSGADGAVFLPGASDAIRVAELQSALSRIAEAEGVQLKSTRSLPPRERETVRMLGVEARLSASIEQVQKILYKLETQRPHLFIEALQITPLAAFVPSSASTNTALDVRIDVLGAAERPKG